MAKILIVEDDPLMSRMYQKIFTFEGYEVEVASDGQEGLSKAKNIKPTLILLDVMMPKMNGLQVLDSLKADEQMKAIPVIMLTNLAGQQDAETALAKGAVKYIIKSEYEPKQVTNMVKEVLAGYTRNEIPGSSSAPTQSTVAPVASPVTVQTPAPVQSPIMQPSSPTMPLQQVPTVVSTTPSDDMTQGTGNSGSNGTNTV